MAGRLEMGRHGSSEEEFSMLGDGHLKSPRGIRHRPWVLCAEKYMLVCVAIAFASVAISLLATLSGTMSGIYDALMEEDSGGFEALRPLLTAHETDFGTLFTSEDDATVLYMEFPTSTVSGKDPLPLLFNAIFSEATVTDDGAYTLLNYPADTTDDTLFYLRLTEDGSGIDVLQALLTLRNTNSVATVQTSSDGPTQRLTTLSIISEKADYSKAEAEKDDSEAASDDSEALRLYVVDASELVENGFYVTVVQDADVADWRLNLNKTRAFPLNADVAVEFLVASEGLGIDATSLDAKALPDQIPLSFRFSISAAPRAPMVPRLADERVGFFTTDFADLGDHEAEFSDANVPKRQSEMFDTTVSVINKRRIGGSDDPLKYYVDPSVPMKWRAAIRRGVEAWKPAFKSLGYGDAAIRAVLPGEPDWPEDYDAGDIRYNSISWAVDTLETFALGPANLDPRTGEILRSDIVFTHGWVRSWLTEMERLDITTPSNGPNPAVTPSNAPSSGGNHNRRRRRKLVNSSLNGVQQQKKTQQERVSHGHGHHSHAHARKGRLYSSLFRPKDKAGNSLLSQQSSLRHHSHHDCQSLRSSHDAGVSMLRMLKTTAAAAAAAPASGSGSQARFSKVPDSVIEQGLAEVVMHEVGHTLGLRHNFRGSAAYNLKDLQDKAFTTKHGLSSTVMDYMAVNIASSALRPKGGYDAVDLFMPCIGEYDHWVIEYGYKKLDGETLLAQHPDLVTVADRALPFVTDEDGSDQFGMDPLSSVFDLGSDPLEFYSDRLQLVKELRPQLLDRSVAVGETFANLAKYEGTLLLQVLWSGRYAGKYVGGFMASKQRRQAVVATTTTTPAAAAGAQKQQQQQQITPLTPVPFEKQREALDMVLTVLTEPTGTGLFADGGVQDYYVKMGGVCEGLERYCLGVEVYDLPAKTLLVRKTTLESLFDPERLARLRLQEWMAAPAGSGGGGGSSSLGTGALGLRDVFSNVTVALFGDELFGSELVAQQQHWELQLLYVDILLGLAESKSDKTTAEVAAVATGQLYDLSKSTQFVTDPAASPLAETFLRKMRLFESGTTGLAGAKKSS